MITIGVTGGVGAGKSEILRHLAEHYNSRILMSDNAAKDLEKPGGPLVPGSRHPDKKGIPKDSRKIRMAFFVFPVTVLTSLFRAFPSKGYTFPRV